MQFRHRFISVNNKFLEWGLLYLNVYIAWNQIKCSLDSLGVHNSMCTYFPEEIVFDIDSRWRYQNKENYTPPYQNLLFSDLFFHLRCTNKHKTLFRSAAAWALVASSNQVRVLFWAICLSTVATYTSEAMCTSVDQGTSTAQVKERPITRHLLTVYQTRSRLNICRQMTFFEIVQTLTLRFANMEKWINSLNLSTLIFQTLQYLKIDYIFSLRMIEIK